MSRERTHLLVLRMARLECIVLISKPMYLSIVFPRELFALFKLLV